jgi:hypothetical protein
MLQKYKTFEVDTTEEIAKALNTIVDAINAITSEKEKVKPTQDVPRKGAKK